MATHQNASEIMPNGCEDKLIFGQNHGLCGTFCKQDSDGHVITRRSENKNLRSGWTIYTRFVLISFFHIRSLRLLAFEQNLSILHKIKREWHLQMRNYCNFSTSIEIDQCQDNFDKSCLNSSLLRSSITFIYKDKKL